MNIRLKRIIKIGLPLIIFLINICSAAEEENEENQKKQRVIFFFLQGKCEGMPKGNIIKRIENIDDYLEYDKEEKKYKVKEGFEEMLVGIYNSLLKDENKKVNFNNNAEEPLCTVDCNKEDHMMTLPTCGQRFCKYAFSEVLQDRLFNNKKIITCPKYVGRSETNKGHLCSFSLGKVKIIKNYDGVKKYAEINEELSNFLGEFGNKFIGQDEGKNISLRDFIKKIILDGASDKDFKTGAAKKCIYCQTTLYKKNCIGETNKIQCTDCGEEFICFKCLCKCDDSRIDHGKCIDSRDCDLFQGYGTGKVFVGEKDDGSPNDDGFEDFETNKYYHPRRCYNCKEYMGKDRQCNHATCPCGAQWCWFCGAPYDNNHWDKLGNCYNLHFKGDFGKNFESSLNDRMKLNDDDLFPWERTKDMISKEEIQNFIKLRQPILDEIEISKQDVNDQFCCNCFLDCLGKIKNCFSEI